MSEDNFIVSFLYILDIWKEGLTIYCMFNILVIDEGDIEN